MQDPKNPAKFCIVERYEQESSQQYHLNNPVSLSFGSSRCPPPFDYSFQFGSFLLANVPSDCVTQLTASTGRHVNSTLTTADKADEQTFDPYVMPLLAKPMDLTRWEEM